MSKKINLKDSFAESLKTLLSLPKGIIYIRSGILQSGDIRQDITAELNKTLAMMGKPPENPLLPKAVSHGAPTDADVADALKAVYDAFETQTLKWGAVTPPARVIQGFYAEPVVYVSTQGNFLTYAKSMSSYNEEDTRTYCYQEIGDDGGQEVCVA